MSRTEPGAEETLAEEAHLGLLEKPLDAQYGAYHCV